MSAPALLVLLACGDGATDDRVRDGGVVPTPADAGHSDAGPRDAGRPPACNNGICEPGEEYINCCEWCSFTCTPDVCTDGTEGCECVSSFAGSDTAFAQDDCDADLICIPWDKLSARDDVMLPVQSCVRPCATDDDCGLSESGAPRSCVSMDVPDSSVAIGRMCVDRVAPIDGYCGGSKNENVLVTTEGARVKTGDEQVGCEPDATCAFNVDRRLNPDEGVCIQTCDAGDPPCPSDFPYCNPNAVRVGSSTVSVCSVGRLGFGAWCDFSEDPDRAGLVAQCDRGGPAELGCLDLTVINIPAGICIENCNEGGTEPDDPCVSTDPDNRVFCQVLDPATGDGVCVHDDVASFPDTCGGAGAYGHGRLGFGVVFGDERVPANWCVDRLAPVLAPAWLGTDRDVSDPGDNCAGRPLDEYRCPEPTLCVGDGSGTNGVCLVSCVLGEDTHCNDALTMLGRTSTNAVCIDQVLSSTVVGLCAGD